MSVVYGRAARTASAPPGWRIDGVPYGDVHLIDATDGQFVPWTARCGAICGWRSTTMPLDGERICPECEARP